MALKHRVVQRFERRDRSTETVHELVTGAFNTWLQGKTSVPNHLDGRLQNIGAGYAASFQKVTVEGRGEALRWKFITGAAPHIYRSTITVLLEQNPREPSWVWFDVETDRENSHFSPPRLTGLLTRQLESSPRDRISGFTQGMRKVAAEDLGKFLDEVLEAEDRTVPAFVSGGRDWSLEDEEHVERALQPLYGIGTFWKLAPDAFDEFNSMVGSGYSVYSGSIHSFQFGLDTTDEKDTRRHWWFSPAEVRQASPRDLSRRMHTEAMQSGLHVPLPDRLSSLNPLFDQLETRRLFGQFQVARASGLQTDPPPARMPTVAPRPVPRPPVLKPIVPAPEAVRPVAHAEPEAGEPSTQSHSLNPGEVGSAVEDASTNSAELDRLLVDTADEFEVLIPQEHGLVQRFVALFAGVRDRLNRNVAVEADMDSINQIQIQFEGIQQEKAALQSEVTVLNELLSHADQEAEEQGDVLEAQRQIAATAKARADHLAGELAKLSQMHGVSVNWESENKVQAFDPTALPTPSSVGEFFAQLDKLQHVRFSGDRKYAERITDLKLRGLILRDAWRYACELEKYAIAQKKDGGPGNLRAYVAEFTTQITHNEFAPDETKKLKETQKFYQPRMLPVPTSVDPAGKVFMGAHFRLSQDNGKAMRMHVHDATKQDGIVYIGYIGQHLPSSKTS